MIITEQTLLDEIAAEMAEELDPLTEVSSLMLKERTGRALSTCERYLKAAEERGEMVSREALRNGRRVRAYRKADK